MNNHNCSQTSCNVFHGKRACPFVLLIHDYQIMIIMIIMIMMVMIIMIMMMVMMMPPRFGVEPPPHS